MNLSRLARHRRIPMRGKNSFQKNGKSKFSNKKSETLISADCR